MNCDFLRGERVRLTARNAATDAPLLAQWSYDSEYLRLSDAGPARLYSLAQIQEYLEKESAAENPHAFFFAIRTLAEERVIGDIELDGIRWTHGDAFVGISIGERALWSQGYGSDALRVILRFAFDELNLHRVSLNTFEYNPRAIRAYLKCGFQIEGRQRRALNRNGKRWDVIYMGILRAEWANSAR